MPKKHEEKLTATLEFTPMEGFGGGFRQEWLSGENDQGKVGLDSGAGLGNTLLTFWIEPKGGERRYYTASMTVLLQLLADQANAQNP